VDELEQKRGSFGNVLVITGATLACYVLSPPLFLTFVRKSPQGDAWMDFYTIFYGPLGWLFDHNQAVHAFYTSYFHLFGINP
jgi:hypothetical protein